jgi:hypothetical protein
MDINLYNNVNGVILVCIIFTLVMYHRGKIQCACNIITSNCYRREILGTQYNRFILFVFIGIGFPSFFWTFQILGILFEFFEMVLDKNEKWTMKNLGGCLSKGAKNIKNSMYNFKVYKGIDKYVNPVDRFFNIKNSKLHFWHGSVAEIISNIIGFIIGIGINASIIYYILAVS